MAKTKKATTKSVKSTAKKDYKPLEAPRIKLPEDDLPPKPQPTISGMLAERFKAFLAYFVKHRKKVIVALLLLAVGAWAVTNYLETRNQLDQLANPKTSTQTEITIITDQVKDTVELPTGETPTIATVSDVEKLKSQNFFKDAENGDKVLIYSKAGKALLYRYTTKKVIEYSNVSLGSQQQSTQDKTQNQPQQQTGQNPTQQPTTQTAPATTQPTQ